MELPCEAELTALLLFYSTSLGSITKRNYLLKSFFCKKMFQFVSRFRYRESREFPTSGT